MLNQNSFSKIETTSQIRVFMYLRYSEHGMVNQNKYIFDQNKEYLPNTRIHVFEVFGHGQPK